MLLEMATHAIKYLREGTLVVRSVVGSYVPRFVMAHPYVTTIPLLLGIYTLLNTVFDRRQKLPRVDPRTITDVSGMNSQIAHHVIMPTSIEDCRNAILHAKQRGLSISTQGQGHTMGGQSVARDSIHLKMDMMNRIIAFDRDAKTVVVEPGIVWSDLIHFLGRYGFALVTQQSYSSFSAGGSVGPNAHGITSDRSLVNSVVSMKVLLHDGTLVECSRIKNRQLFSLVNGGYGMFGIIVEMTLKVNTNKQLRMMSQYLNPSTFSAEYAKYISDENTGIKLGRINVGNWKEVALYRFAVTNDNVISHHTGKPSELGFGGKLIYKWFMHNLTVQKFRFWLEKLRGSPLDWQVECDTNSSLYADATSFAELTSPLIRLQQTHILQEFFVPHDRLEEWISQAGRFFTETKFANVSLLNATIRYVKEDNSNDVFLRYAKQDMYAIVLYYRVGKRHEGDEELRRVHNHLVNVTLGLNGTFYLPYRHHYTLEQLREAYPQWDQFVTFKRVYDPDNLFTSEWWKDYSATAVACDVTLEPLDTSVTNHNLVTDPTDFVKEQTSSTIRLRQVTDFATNVFYAIERETATKLVQELANASDYTLKKFYDGIATYVNKQNGISRALKQLEILGSQRKELVTETKQLLEKIGIQSVNGMISIGDPGRYVRATNKACNVSGKHYVVHDSISGVPAMIERQSVFAVGEHIRINYDAITPDVFKKVPTASVEMVTLYQGLHHFDPQSIANLLNEIARVLVPRKGVFILRDHNGREDLKPMIEFAHTYFNAITGVPYDTDRAERRDFKTIDEWRELLAGHGLIDQRVYMRQLHDPTENYLMAFVRQDDVPSAMRASLDASQSYKRAFTSSLFTPIEWATVDMPRQYSDFLHGNTGGGPFYMFPYINSIQGLWKLYWKQFSASKARDGLFGTIFSDGFVVGTSTAVFTTAEYLMKSIFSAPIRWLCTTPGLTAVNEEELVIETVVPPVGCKIKSSVGNIHHVEVPRYDAFTIFVKGLATNEGNKVLEVAGNKEIQVKILVFPGQELLRDELLKTFVVRETFFGTVVPTFGEENTAPPYSLVTVNIVDLLRLLRYCSTKGLNVQQCFDM